MIAADRSLASQRSTHRSARIAVRAGNKPGILRADCNPAGQTIMSVHGNAFHDGTNIGTSKITLQPFANRTNAVNKKLSIKLARNSYAIRITKYCHYN